MIRFSSLPMAVLAAATLLSACGPTSNSASAEETLSSNESGAETGVVQASLSAAEELGVEDNVMIAVDRLIPEEEACLVMMNVVNGTEDTVTAGLFAFDVSGNGETAGANMFPQTTAPGDVVTAQIILPGADCDNAQIIEGGQINCRIVESGESCVDDLELRDGVVDFTLND